MSLFPLPQPPAGEPYKNFCEKGGRFGPHNVNHEIHLPDVEKPGNLIYLTYFNAGLRVFNIKDPLNPVESGWFIPPTPLKRYGPQPPNDLVQQSEDVLVDTRGYIYLDDKHWGLLYPAIHRTRSAGAYGEVAACGTGRAWEPVPVAPALRRHRRRPASGSSAVALRPPPTTLRSRYASVSGSSRGTRPCASESRSAVGSWRKRTTRASGCSGPCVRLPAVVASIAELTQNLTPGREPQLVDGELEIQHFLEKRIDDLRRRDSRPQKVREAMNLVFELEIPQRGARPIVLERVLQAVTEHHAGVVKQGIDRGHAIRAVQRAVRRHPALPHDVEQAIAFAR